MALRDAFDRMDVATIERFVAERRTEDLHLDFKTLGDPRDFSREDRKNLAKAISGFANSDGGIVVWGVDRRKTGGIAVAQEKPLPDADQTRSRLEELTSDAASPLVDGVLHKALCRPDKSGFVSTYVPRSETGPHMAKFGEDRYFKRSGDSFRKMEHFDIEDMFGRRPKPKLMLTAQIRPEGITSAGTTFYTFSVVLGIRNDGRALARYPSLRISVTPTESYRLSHYGLDGNRRTGLPQLVSSGSTTRTSSFAGGMNDVVHVDSVVEITRVEGPKVFESNMSAPDLTIQYRINAEGMIPVESVRTVTGKEIVDFLEATYKQGAIGA